MYARLIAFIEQTNLHYGFLLLFLFFYHAVYVAVALARRLWPQAPDVPAAPHRYAVLISARNEEAVLPRLIGSLLAQRYPAECLRIFVVADNCQDATAEAARRAGATVYERHDPEHRGKGYALNWLLSRMEADGHTAFDGYFVFDADNVAEPDFVSRMNDTFSTGRYGAITSYRNAGNYGENWVSAGYGLWFLREACFLNAPRSALGVSCHLSGTGFLASAEVIRQNGGWPFHLLTEDIEFSADCVAKGIRIGFCPDAVIYDEQPTSFRQSWVQRERWCRGFLQVLRRSGARLLRGLLSGGLRQRWSCYDMLMLLSPAALLAGFTGFLALLFLYSVIFMPVESPWVLLYIVRMLLMAAVQNYGLFFAYGLGALLCERRRVQCSMGRALVLLLTFPVFVFSYAPITITSLFRRVEWKPIVHTGARTYRE